jgi:hypothetical protein
MAATPLVLLGPPTINLPFGKAKTLPENPENGGKIEVNDGRKFGSRLRLCAGAAVCRRRPDNIVIIAVKEVFIVRSHTSYTGKFLEKGQTIFNQALEVRGERLH